MNFVFTTWTTKVCFHLYFFKETPAKAYRHAGIIKSIFNKHDAVGTNPLEGVNSGPVELAPTSWGWTLPVRMAPSLFTQTQCPAPSARWSDVPLGQRLSKEGGQFLLSWGCLQRWRTFLLVEGCDWHPVCRDQGLCGHPFHAQGDPLKQHYLTQNIKSGAHERACSQ